jgi:hypothetical protein
MVSNIVHRIFKKGKTYSLFTQFLSRPAGMTGSMNIGFGAVTLITMERTSFFPNFYPEIQMSKLKVQMKVK